MDLGGGKKRQGMRTTLGTERDRSRCRRSGSTRTHCHDQQGSGRLYGEEVPRVGADVRAARDGMVYSGSDVLSVCRGRGPAAGLLLDIEPAMAR